MDIMLERILSLIPRKPNGDFVHGTITEFSEKVGIESPNLVSDWKAGRSKSYRRYLHDIANAYNVSVEWLKGETDIKEKPATETGDGLDTETRELLDFVMNATQNDKTVLLSVIRGLKSRDSQE